MVYSGAWGKLIHEKNKKSKIFWHYPFKSARGFARETDTHRLSLPQILSSCCPFCGLNLIFSLLSNRPFCFLFRIKGFTQHFLPHRRGLTYLTLVFKEPVSRVKMNHFDLNGQYTVFSLKIYCLKESIHGVVTKRKLIQLQECSILLFQSCVHTFQS